jgi:hypothetical protein
VGDLERMIENKKTNKEKDRVKERERERERERESERDTLLLCDVCAACFQGGVGGLPGPSDGAVDDVEHNVLLLLRHHPRPLLLLPAPVPLLTQHGESR